ncbi:MAG: sulfotransferase family 2 domain-containing protein [Mariniblastus sp.]
MTSVDPTTKDPAALLRQCWLHVHVPKAGGSTLRQLMNRNFGDGYYNSQSLLETKQYTRTDVSEIIRCHPGVSCFSDHKLSLDLPFQHEHASVFALSYVRNPVDRFISRYFFHRHFEEVNCIAQRMSFREFANAELVEQEVHPQTNSQIYFLNGGKSFDDMTIINEALETGKAFLFPIERFDESCICMERMFPTVFSDLSYVRANVSKRDAEITDEERQLAHRYLKSDDPVFQLAEDFLDKMLKEAFHSEDDSKSALAEFKDRCSRRYDNFYPPVKPGEPVPPVGTIPEFPKPTKPTEPVEPVEHDPNSKEPPSQAKPTAEKVEELEERPVDKEGA